MNNRNTKYTDYKQEDALDKLLTDLSPESSKLLGAIGKRISSGNWRVVDIHNSGDNYDALVYQESSREFIKFKIDDEYPFLKLALKRDLLQYSALISSLHPSHLTHSTTDVIRLRLSEGIRTPRSKAKGFRWDAEAAYLGTMREERIYEDLDDLAYNLVDYMVDSKVSLVDDGVKWLKATTEEIIVVVKRLIVASIPFDHYPFLGAKILKQEEQKLTGDLIDDLNRNIRNVHKAT